MADFRKCFTQNSFMNILPCNKEGISVGCTYLCVGLEVLNFYEVLTVINIFAKADNSVCFFRKSIVNNEDLTPGTFFSLDGYRLVAGGSNNLK